VWEVVDAREEEGSEGGEGEIDYSSRPVVRIDKWWTSRWMDNDEEDKGKEAR
jgi:hypothetical protein